MLRQHEQRVEQNTRMEILLNSTQSLQVSTNEMVRRLPRRNLPMLRSPRMKASARDSGPPVVFDEGAEDPGFASGVPSDNYQAATQIETQQPQTDDPATISNNRNEKHKVGVATSD